MRYGVISDVHANLHALDATLGFLDRHGVDGYLCAGDLVGYGPSPNECVERIAALGASCVAGNHDLVALGALPLDDCAPLAADSLAWTQTELSDAARAYLARLPALVDVGDGVVMVHATLDDPRPYLLTAAQIARELARLEGSRPGARALVSGHTHLARAFGARAGTIPFVEGDPVDLARGAPVSLNPGSVGQARERAPWARCALLDAERLEATFFALDYDVEGCRRELVRKGRPPTSCHAPPPGVVARGARKLVRVVRSGDG
ncbi:MAG TPA: metallophosphoesterase family protein [Actinomycetota bacterium]|nr:metallophosphoesterase family protein [Actinomycetota bacterium]